MRLSFSFRSSFLPCPSNLQPCTGTCSLRCLYGYPTQPHTAPRKLPSWSCSIQHTSHTHPSCQPRACKPHHPSGLASCCILSSCCRIAFGSSCILLSTPCEFGLLSRTLSWHTGKCNGIRTSGCH